MKFDPRWNLKWFDCKSIESPEFVLTTTKKCVLVAVDDQGALDGFTVFEPRDFMDDFLARLEQRMKREEFHGKTWKLILPDYLKSRWEGLKTAHPALSLEVVYSSFAEIKRYDSLFQVRHRLRVVNVDDSPVLLKILKSIFDEFGFVDVVAQISDSTLAVSQILELSPDLVTLDIQMPKLTGVDVVRELFGVRPFPIIMVSSLTPDAGSLVFDALNAGAFDYIQKPRLEDKDEFVAELLKKTLTAVEGRKSVVRPPAVRVKREEVAGDYSRSLLWAVGSSTGGTQALTQIFTSLPAQIPATVIVQHIPAVFSRAFAESLNALCPFRVKEAEDGERLHDNHVYIAPGGLQMAVEERSGGFYLKLSNDPEMNRFKPSVDFLFKSLKKLKSVQIVAAVLTGMGRDGAEGLLELRQSGARTLAQSEETCAVFGMPRAAIERGAAESVVDLDQVAQQLLSFSRAERRSA